MTSATRNTAQHSINNSGRASHKLNVWKKLFIGLSLGAAAMAVQADAYEDGLMAYAVGNFAGAGQAFTQAANEGNAGAEHMLMRLFSENKIYAKDLAQETLKWLVEKQYLHKELEWQSQILRCSAGARSINGERLG